MAANRRKHRGGEIVINPERTRYDEHARLFDQHVSAKRPTRTSWWTAAAKRTITFTLAEMAAYPDLSDSRASYEEPSARAMSGVQEAADDV